MVVSQLVNTSRTNDQLGSSRPKQIGRPPYLIGNLLCHLTPWDQPSYPKNEVFYPYRYILWKKLLSLGPYYVYNELVELFREIEGDIDIHL